jgi:hypothetical protein
MRSSKRERRYKKGREEVEKNVGRGRRRRIKRR